jgi:hypothetical protein
MTKFETGKTYATRSIGDHNCIFTIKVIKRSKTMITVETSLGETKRVKVTPDWQNADVETCMALGKYSMAPVWNAAEDLVD